MVSNAFNFIGRFGNEFVVGFISGLVSSIIVTIVNNHVLAKSKSKYDDCMKKIFAQDLNVLISKNQIDDFIDSIIVSLRTCSLNNNTIKEIDRILPIIANFASAEEVSNINYIKLILKKLIDISREIINSCNSNWNLITNVISDIYNIYKSEIDNKEIALINKNKLSNFLVNNKNITKTFETTYNNAIEYIMKNDLLQACIEDYNKQFDNHTEVYISSLVYKTLAMNNKYYCGRCSKEVKKNSKICANCGAKLS